jgi:hypothetical protein
MFFFGFCSTSRAIMLSREFHGNGPEGLFNQLLSP